MPTLRDRVRETLSAREPSERNAAADLETVLARSKKGRRVWPLVLAPALAAAALVLYLVSSRHDAPAPQVVAQARGVHLYLHVTGEPENQAIALDLDSKGDR